MLVYWKKQYHKQKRRSSLYTVTDVRLEINELGGEKWIQNISVRA
jgi:hypothetical protein